MISSKEWSIDFTAITQMFSNAANAGRFQLLEHETYELLHKSGAETPPKTMLLPKGERFSDDALSRMPGDRVVLKIVSPTILHKSDLDGVRIVENSAQKIRSAWRRMLQEIPERYASQIEADPGQGPEAYRPLQGKALRDAIASDLIGILMVQYMPPDSEAFGNEMIVSLRHTREFGMILSAGLGGTDTELYAQRFQKGQAIVAASVEMTDGRTFFSLFRKTISYKKLAGLTRGQRRIVTDWRSD